MGYGMSLITRAEETTVETKAPGSLTLRVPDEARILIVCENDADTERLRTVFREAGFISECAQSMTAGCESAKSGRFQVVFTAPLLSDGSWRRLIDVANHFDLDFEVVLLARTFDLNQWAEALKDGAFDVLDYLYDLPRAAETLKSALWAAYLKGAGLRPEAASPRRRLD